MPVGGFCLQPNVLGPAPLRPSVRRHHARMTINTQTSSIRWIGLLGFSIALQIMVMLVIGFITARHAGFVVFHSLWIVALFCLPAAWAAFSLWRFRSTAE